MSTPRSCTRCLSLLPELVSPGDRCPQCGSAIALIETQQGDSTPAPTPPGPDTPIPGPVTPSFVPADPHAPTPTDPIGLATAAFAARKATRPPVLANYDLHEPIGIGGMGVVYRAMQKRAGRIVAVKVIQTFGGIPPTLRARFDTEAQALGRLTHPNIVPVYEVGEEDGHPFFSMEYISGGNLAERVRDGKRLPAREAAGLIARAAAGVDAAHRLGVLHRDLKPGNILVAADGTPKVADFGLAKLLDRDDGPSVSGCALGTPNYMAPEQAGGKSDAVSPLTDVYGLGATLYHLLTGRPPFKDEGPVGTALRAATEAPPTPRSLCPDLCPVLEAVVQKAMAKAPSERYASAQALSKDLDSWSRGEPTIAQPITRLQAAAKWAKRHRVRLVVAAGILVPLIVALGLFVQRVVDDRRLEAQAIAKKEADPLWQLERDLKTGMPVDLVPEKGPPRWSEWHVNAVALTESSAGDGGSGFQTLRDSALVLVKEVPWDHYRLTLELRHILANKDDGVVGVFVGMHDVPARKDMTATQWVAFEYSDFIRGIERRDPFVRDKHALEGASYLTIRVQEKQHLNQWNLRSSLLTPTDKTPNNYRAFVVDVTPQGVTVSRPAIDGTLTSPLFVPAERIRDVLSNHSENVAKSYPGVAIPPVEWNPRRAIGVFARNSDVAFRKVRIEPRPAP